MSEDPYKSLRDRLDENFKWPREYLFKFIFLQELRHEDKLKEILSPFVTSKIKQSSKGKYISLSISKQLPSPDSVIEIYKIVGKIEGVIAL